MSSAEFQHSLALFDAAGHLVDWDEGFAREWLYAAPHLTVGAIYGDLVRQAVANPDAKQFLADNFEFDAAEVPINTRIAGFGQERTSQYTIDGRTIEVHEWPTRRGGVLRVARDVTEARTAEDALTAAQHQLMAADAESDGVLVEVRRNPDGSYVFPPVTDALRRFLDLPNEAVGCDPMLVHTRMQVSPGDDARLGVLLERSAQTLEICSIEYRVRDGRDRMRWIRQSMMPRREADGTVIFSGVMRDVTREKQAEDQVELLRSVVVRSGDSIVIFETAATERGETTILYANRKFAELFECEAETIIGKSSDVLQIDTTSRANSRALVAARRRGDGAPIEFESRSPSGRLFWVEARVETVQTLDDGTFRWVVISRDISERRRAQAELLRAKEAAEAGNRAKSNFLANMSHELRTPLNAIIGFTELIQRGVARNGWNDAYTEYFADILDSGQHLLELINSVLDLSKIEAGSLALDLGPVDLRRLIQTSIELVHGLADSGAIAIKANLPDESPEIPADFLKLKQVLLNILSNAIKFTPAGGKVTIDLLVTREVVEIVVSDTGCGISEADLERVMQPFVQVENSLSRRFAGSGLGLSIARELCALHGGRLTIESIEGEGTTVRICLPRSTDETEAQG